MTSPVSAYACDQRLAIEPSVVTSGTVDVGAIIAMIAYVAFYTAGFDEVPGVLQRLTRLRDIKRRLDDPASAAPSKPSP